MTQETIKGLKEARQALIDEALEAINATHAWSCPWLLNAAAECTCGALDLGLRVEAVIASDPLPFRGLDAGILHVHEALATLCEWFGQREAGQSTTNSEAVMFARCSQASDYLDAALGLASEPVSNPGELAPPFRGEGDNLRLLRCIHSAMGCLDAVYGGVDQRLGWLRLLDAVEGREPRGTREFSALERPEDLVQRARLRLRDGPPIEGFDHANDVVMIHRLCALIAASPALVTPGEEDSSPSRVGVALDLRPMADARRDGAPVLAKMRDDIYPTIRPERDDLESWNGRWVVIHHRGLASDGWDQGWSLSAPVGHGGFPDEWFEGWVSLPLSSAKPALGDSSRDAQETAVTPGVREALPERILWLLRIIVAAGGRTDASDSPHHPINAFCGDIEPLDTFNEAIERGLTRVTHDSMFDTSTVFITDAGRQALAALTAPVGEG